MAHARSSRLHLIGLVSPGGVHSHADHLYALLEMAARENVEQVFVHAFTDGRDEPPRRGGPSTSQPWSERWANSARGESPPSAAAITPWTATSAGRASNEFLRVIVLGEGRQASDPVQAVRDSYASGTTDEFIEPVVLVDEQGEPVGRIADGDAAIFFNFRADRARQITDALNDPALEGIDRSPAPKNLHYVTMTQYDRRYSYPHVLPPHQPDDTLAHISEAQGWRNLRVAETEKYPHVTYFFNGGREKPFRGEERQMVPSPRVATYDLQPEMSAPGVCDVVVDGVESGSFDWIVVNFANGDMVGPHGQARPPPSRRSKPSTIAWAESAPRSKP